MSFGCYIQLDSGYGFKSVVGFHLVQIICTQYDTLDGKHTVGIGNKLRCLVLFTQFRKCIRAIGA